MTAPWGVEFDHDFLGALQVLVKVRVGQRQDGIGPGGIGLLCGGNDKDKRDEQARNGAQAIQCLLTV